jgi:hypothetical protein
MNQGHHLPLSLLIASTRMLGQSQNKEEKCGLWREIQNTIVQHRSVVTIATFASAPCTDSHARDVSMGQTPLSLEKSVVTHKGIGSKVQRPGTGYSQSSHPNRHVLGFRWGQSGPNSEVLYADPDPALPPSVSSPLSRDLSNSYPARREDPNPLRHGSQSRMDTFRPVGWWGVKGKKNLQFVEAWMFSFITILMSHIYFKINPTCFVSLYFAMLWLQIFIEQNW